MLPVPTVPASVDIIVPVFNQTESIDEFYQRVDRFGYADGLLFRLGPRASLHAAPPTCRQPPGVGALQRRHHHDAAWR